MSEYLIHWAHAYLIHFGAWVSLAIGTELNRFGPPALNRIPKILKSSIVLAAVASLFSSHSHIHYLQNLLK